MLTGDLERAVLEALAYSDVFEYPLRLDELYRYLPIRAEMDDLLQALRATKAFVGSASGYYFLTGREGLVSNRRDREACSQKLLPQALRYGKILGALPFVRMVALTGSLAVMNVSKNTDFDYMLVAKRGRVWTARAFALLLNRVASLFGHTLCPNLIISGADLEWHQRDLYSARELCQMIPMTGFDVYQILFEENEWVNEFLPNATLNSDSLRSGWQRYAASLQRFGEFLLIGNLGDKLEHWEMTRKIKRFSKQTGFGEETIFTADICQGNFDHHRKATYDLFKQRLMNYLHDSSLPLEEVVEVRI